MRATRPPAVEASACDGGFRHFLVSRFSRRRVTRLVCRMESTITQRSKLRRPICSLRREYFFPAETCFGREPPMRQKFVEVTCQSEWQSRQDVLQVGVRVVAIELGGLDEAHDDRRSLAGTPACLQRASSCGRLPMAGSAARRGCCRSAAEGHRAAEALSVARGHARHLVDRLDVSGSLGITRQAEKREGEHPRPIRRASPILGRDARDAHVALFHSLFLMAFQPPQSGRLQQAATGRVLPTCYRCATEAPEPW